MRARIRGCFCVLDRAILAVDLCKCEMMAVSICVRLCVCVCVCGCKGVWVKYVERCQSNMNKAEEEAALTDRLQRWPHSNFRFLTFWAPRRRCIPLFTLDFYVLLFLLYDPFYWNADLSLCLLYPRPPSTPTSGHSRRFHCNSPDVRSGLLMPDATDVPLQRL